MVIMDLWGMFYHPVVVRVRIFVLLLDLISAYCGPLSHFYLHLYNKERNLCVSLSEQCPNTRPASISRPILQLITSMDSPDTGVDVKNILEVIGEQTEKFEHKNCAET